MTYDFRQQKAAGGKGESVLDTFFRQWYVITPATEAEQRLEIDRWFERANRRFAVEYKTDALAHKTHNAFIETVSVDTQHKPGWIHMSFANVLMYYVPREEVIYEIAFAALRLRFPALAASYPLKSVPNRGYSTWGIIVPLAEFERLAIRVHSL